MNRGEIWKKKKKKNRFQPAREHFDFALYQRWCNVTMLISDPELWFYSTTSDTLNLVSFLYNID